jgi:ATP/maltotriose-dependent transcriptional regulator MalT
MLSWRAQLDEAKKEIGELEDRISVLKAELDVTRWAADAARLQGIVAVREQHLERAKFHAQFIESRIATGQRATKPIQYSALATICFNAAQRTAQVDTAETLKALAKNFSAKATADASRRLFESDSPASIGDRTSPASRAIRSA